MGEGSIVHGRGVAVYLPRAQRVMIRVFGDNHGGISLAENPLSSARSKHIYGRAFHFFVSELLRAKNIDIQFVAPEEQHADTLTKSLAATPCNSHGRFLLNLPLEGERVFVRIHR